MLYANFVTTFDTVSDHRKRHQSTRTRHNRQILLRWARKGVTADGRHADGQSHELPHPQGQSVSLKKTTLNKAYKTKQIANCLINPCLENRWTVSDKWP